MKKLTLMLLLMLANLLLQAQTTIPSYEIKVKFNDSEKKLYIDAALKFWNIQQEKLELLLSSNSKITSINYLDGNKSREITYSLKGKDTIELELGNKWQSNPNPVIDFSYTYPTGDDTLILLDRGHRWYPMIAENIEVFGMEIEVPKNYIAVSAGEQMNNNDKGPKIYTFLCRVPVFKIPLIIAPLDYYSVNSTNCGNIKTTVYYLPGSNVSAIDSIQTVICSHLEYFSSKFGSYPFNCFTMVETSAFEGTNLGSSIITAGSANIKGFSSGYKEWLNLAVASQWIGAGVFPKLFCKGFWFLSLSLPHYLRLMYIKDMQGEEAFNKELDELAKKYNSVAGTDGDIPIIEIHYPDTKEKGILIYAKGVLVLHELQKLMGETNWTDMLKYFHENYYGKIILLDDLVDCINKFDTTGESSAKLIKMLSEKGSIN